MASNAVRGPLSPRRSYGEAHATRPSLNRLASDLVLAALQGGPGRVSRSNDDGVRRSLDELGPWTKATDAEGQRQAVVHDLTRSDTLASLALQYGCTVQALRQANRLWANDSIHLRKQLFIPLDACTVPPAKELIERIEVEGETIRILSRALPRAKPASPAATPLTAPLLARINANGSTGRRSMDLDLLASSTRTSMDSSASLYLAETNPTYPTSPTSPTSPSVATLAVEAKDDSLGELIERVLKLGVVPAPPSAAQPFFRISPSTSTVPLPEPAPKPMVKKERAKAPSEALAMKSTGWDLADDDELRLASKYVRRSGKGSNGSSRGGWL